MTQQFKEFKIGDIFVKLSTKYLGKGKKTDNISKKNTLDFSLPLTYAKRGNNGIMYWGREEDWEHHSNTISIITNGAVASGLVYAQKDCTGVLGESYLIKLKEDKNNIINFRVYLYISKVIEKTTKSKYSREFLATWGGKVENDIINLPVTLDGELDFDYMDNYIKGVEQKYILNLRGGLDDKIANLLELTQKTEDNISDEHVQVLKEKIRLDYSQKEFKEFKVGDIFEVKTGGRVVKSAQIKGDIPYVTAVSTNNGIDTYISNPKFIDENIITVSFLGDVFYHPYKLGYKDGTCGLKLTDNMYQSAYVYTYFTTLLKKVAKQLGSYDKGLIKSDIERISLLLPVTFDGGIDYEFMGNYVRSLESVHIHDFRVCEEERIGLIEGLLV